MNSSPDSPFPVRPSPPTLPPADLGNWFKQEVHPHEPALRSFLGRHFWAIVDIDDLVQEAYARLFKAKAKGEINNARSFLYTTARNIAYDYFRRNRRMTVSDLAEISPTCVLEEGRDAADALSHAQDLEVLNEAIQALPPRCRTIFMLRRLHGLSYKEIAERLGISKHTINAQLAIGLARCRTFLLQRGVIQPRQDSASAGEKNENEE